MSNDEKPGGENPTKQALQILRVLINFGCPKNFSEATSWMERVKSLQSLIYTLWISDESGKMMQECLDVLYEVIAAKSDNVSPAIWNVLEIVDEKRVAGIVKGFLNDSKARLKNALCAIIDGLCQCGSKIPVLQVWTFSFIDGLEVQENYSVLVSVSQSVVGKLLQCLLVPNFRTLIYPVFERLLYPIVSPHVFHKIIDRVPEVIAVLEKEKDDKNTLACLYFFSGLVKTLMIRFPPTSFNEDKYEILRIALSKTPNMIFKPRTVGLWNPKESDNSKLTNILQCPVCYDRLDTPITVCENGHCVCNNCKDRLRGCPICKAPFSSIRMTLMNQIIEMTKFPCRNADSGCDVELLYNKIQSHEAECEYRSVPCELEVDRFDHVIVGFTCQRDVVLANFHNHVETYHKSYISEFELNKEKREVLNYKKVNHIRVLKDENSKLYFIERIYITEEELFFSYHYIGRNADAKNYIYTIKIDGKEIPNKIKYSHFCLPNYMSIDDTEANKRCLVLDPDKVFDARQTEFTYSVKIEVYGIYRLRKIKSSSTSDHGSVPSDCGSGNVK